MLLNEFKTTNETRYAKISKALKSQYGISINESDEDKLSVLSESIAADLLTFRRANVSPQDPRVAKKLLMLEGVKCLLEEISLERPHRVYQTVLAGMTKCACELIDIGDDIDEAVKTCMREYRSSKYRYPDDEVEFDIRNRVKNYIASSGHTPVVAPAETPAEPIVATI